jgi:hypothetical protein
VLESRTAKVVITVLDETKRIGSIETRVVEEREEEDGQLKEVSRNFFAVCKEHGDVFYFGEEVDDYKGGKIVNHSGAWRADEKNSRAGITAVRSKVMDKWQLCVMAESVRQQAEGRSVKNRIFSISGILKGGHVLGLG